MPREEPDRLSRTSSSGIDPLEEQEQATRNDAHQNETLEKQSTAASGLSVFEHRAQSVISRIRSREPGQDAPFTHPLSHTKTSSDVIVDFDGPDDPYRPLNWRFEKKCMTTLLYGLTTMGATWASSVYVILSSVADLSI